MNETVSAYLADRQQEFDEIPSNRKEALQAMADFVKEQRRNGQPVRLLFVCTHNSRRSQLGQIWAAAAAEYCGVPSVCTYSGGTEASAFNPRAVAALQRAGIDVQKTTEDENPIYHVRFSNAGQVVTAFSKVYSQAPNPKQDFCAVMVCNNADRACPSVEGAAARIAIRYEDPKQADGTPAEAKTYDERCRQIAREMLYAMSLVQSAAKSETASQN